MSSRESWRGTSHAHRSDDVCRAGGFALELLHSGILLGALCHSYAGHGGSFDTFLACVWDKGQTWTPFST